MMGSIEDIAKMRREKEWDAICTLNGTDLYGLLDKILEDPHLIDKIKNVKTIFRIPDWFREDEEEMDEEMGEPDIPEGYTLADGRVVDKEK